MSRKEHKYYHPKLENDYQPYDDEDEEDLPPSKTQIKKEMHALQKLGEELVELPKNKLAQLELPENLLDAIHQAQKITNFEGKRRQLQFVGKLMRRIDPEPIAQQLAAWKGQSQAQTDHFHLLENWRERLIANDDAFTELLAQYPELDVQIFRTAIRNARKEKAENKAPRNFRELFQMLKQLMGDEA